MEHTPISKQVWFAIGMAAVLVMLTLAVSLGLAPMPHAGSLANLREVLRSPTPTLSAEGRLAVELPPSSTPTTTPTSAPTETPTPTATATMTRRPTATPLPMTPTAVPPTPRPTQAPYVGPAERVDHYWMIRPVADGANDLVARFYPYGSRQDGSYPVHHGVEFVNPMGTPVLAVADGEIVTAGGDQLRVVGARDDFYGQVIVLRLNRTLQGQAVYALYGHLSEIDVSVGQRVSTGQTLGKVGMSGVAEGPHLHFEVRVGANTYEDTVNPELWVQPLAGRGVLAGVLLDNAGVLASEEARLIVASADGSARYETNTYPAREVNPDPAFQENFAIGDLAAGNWKVSVFYRAQLLEEMVQIAPGKTTWLELRTSR